MSRWEIPHEERVLQKRQRLGMLVCLLDEHEKLAEPDVDYIRDLKARITSVKAGLRNMGVELFD